MKTDLVVLGYAIYTSITILLTFYVAHILFKHSLIFMMDIFRGRQEIAIATNQLFKTGFYLLNIGFALKCIYIFGIESQRALFEYLSGRVGGFSIYLGIVLFFNLYLLFRGKKYSRAEAQA